MFSRGTVWVTAIVLLLVTGCGGVTRTATYAPASLPAVEIGSVESGRFRVLVAAGGSTSPITIQGIASVTKNRFGYSVFLTSPDASGRIVGLQLTPEARPGAHDLKTTELNAASAFTTYGGYYSELDSVGIPVAYTTVQSGSITLESLIPFTARFQVMVFRAGRFFTISGAVNQGAVISE